jgi:hypothetical protein
LSSLGGGDLQRGLSLKKAKFEENLSYNTVNNNDPQGEKWRLNKILNLETGINGNDNIIKGPWSPEEDR